MTIKEARRLRAGDRIVTNPNHFPERLATVESNTATSAGTARVIQAIPDGYTLPRTYILQAGAPVKLAPTELLAAL